MTRIGRPPATRAAQTLRRLKAKARNNGTLHLLDYKPAMVPLDRRAGRPRKPRPTRPDRSRDGDARRA